MTELRKFYGTYTVTMAGGQTGQGRNTFDLTSDGPIPALLSMESIRKAEASSLETVREETYGAKGLMLTWWTEIRDDHPGFSEPKDSFGAHVTDGILGRIGDREIGPGYVVLSEERYRWLFQRAGLPVENLPDVTPAGRDLTVDAIWEAFAASDRHGSGYVAGLQDEVEEDEECQPTGKRYTLIDGYYDLQRVAEILNGKEPQA